MDRVSRLFQVAAQETERGNYKQAVETYREIIKTCAKGEPALHMAYWGIGDIYLNNRQYEKAKYNLKKAIQLAPDEAGYHYLLGCTFRYTEEIDNSIHHLQRAVELDDSRDIFWCELGWVVGHYRDPDEGIEYLKQAMKINPCNARALTDLAVLYTAKHKWSEAFVCIEEASKHDPDNPQIAEIEKKLHLFKSEIDRLTTRKGLKTDPE
jgi:tetratricopeptide (TPR) repeat protein